MEKDDSAVRKLLQATIVSTLFVVGEGLGAYFTGSLAIIGNALHMFSHITGLIASLISIYLSRRGKTNDYSWGYQRAEIIGVLFNMAIVWIITSMMLFEGIRRLILIINLSMEPIDGKMMLSIAALGVLSNFFVLGALGGHHGRNHGPSFSTLSSDVMPSHGRSHDSGGCNHTHIPDQVVNLSQLDSTSIQKLNKMRTAENIVSTAAIDTEHRELNMSVSSFEEIVDHPLSSIASVAGVKERENELNETVAVASDGGHDVVFSKSTNKQENLNIAAANAHIFGNLIQSFGVMIVGGIIWFFPANQYPFAQLVDPIVTFFFTIPVLWTTVGVLRVCFNILMEGVPPHINLKELENDLTRIIGVENVHDLHVWTISTNVVCLSVHLSLSKNERSAMSDVKRIMVMAQCVAQFYGIQESAIQIDM